MQKLLRQTVWTHPAAGVLCCRTRIPHAYQKMPGGRTVLRSNGNKQVMKGIPQCWDSGWSREIRRTTQCNPECETGELSQLQWAEDQWGLPRCSYSHGSTRKTRLVGPSRLECLVVCLFVSYCFFKDTGWLWRINLSCIFSCKKDWHLHE